MDRGGQHLLANKKPKLYETLPSSAKAQCSPPWFGLVPLPFTGLPPGVLWHWWLPHPQAHTPGKDCHPGARRVSNRPKKGPEEAGNASTGRSPEAAGTWQERLWAGQPLQGRVARQATPEQAGGALRARSNPVRGSRAPWNPPSSGSPSGRGVLGLGLPETAAILGLPQRRGSAGPGHWGRRAAPATSSPRARTRRRGEMVAVEGWPCPSVLLGPRLLCTCFPGHMAPLLASPGSLGRCLPAWPGVGWGQVQRSLQWGGLVGEGEGPPVQGVPGCPWLCSGSPHSSSLRGQRAATERRVGRLEARLGRDNEWAKFPSHFVWVWGEALLAYGCSETGPTAWHNSGGSVSASSWQSSVCSGMLFVSEKWWEEYGQTLGVKNGYEENPWLLHCCFCTAGIMLVWVLTMLCVLSSRNSCQLTVPWFLRWGVKDGTAKSESLIGLGR